MGNLVTPDIVGGKTISATDITVLYAILKGEAVYDNVGIPRKLYEALSETALKATTGMKVGDYGKVSDTYYIYTGTWLKVMTEGVIDEKIAKALKETATVSDYVSGETCYKHKFYKENNDVFLATETGKWAAPSSDMTKWIKITGTTTTTATKPSVWGTYITYKQGEDFVYDEGGFYFCLITNQGKKPSTVGMPYWKAIPTTPENTYAKLDGNQTFTGVNSFLNLLKIINQAGRYRELTNEDVVTLGYLHDVLQGTTLASTVNTIAERDATVIKFVGQKVYVRNTDTNGVMKCYVALTTGRNAEYVESEVAKAVVELTGGNVEVDLGEITDVNNVETTIACVDIVSL